MQCLSHCHHAIGLTLSESGITILQLRNLAMAYGGDDVFCNVSLTLKAGSFHFLTGPSGAGKTTLLRLVSLAERPRLGTITLFGRETDRVDRRETAALRQSIGMVFQDFRLLAHLSAFDNIALPLRIGGALEDDVATSVSGLMQWLGLGGVMELRPDQMSMGEQQLVSAARAVVARPRLLLCDEPTSHLDPKRAGRLMQLFVQLNRTGTAVLLVTHSAQLLCHHEFPVLRMTGGRLVLPRVNAARAAA